MILDYLLKGNTITPLEALDLFKCFRLGARMWELKHLDGYNVVEQTIYDERTQKHFSQYRIITEPQLTLNFSNGK